MMTKLLHLVRDERGASIIELALVAPFLATLTIGVIDLSGAYSAKLQLEQAAQRTIEKAMQAPKSEINGLNVDYLATLKAEAAEAADVDEDDVSIRYWLECNGVDQNTDPATMDEDYGEVCGTGGVCQDETGGCGDPTNDGRTTASDALFALNVAVGLQTCVVCVCDVDNSAATSASDALRLLNYAVGIPNVTLNCPTC